MTIELTKNFEDGKRHRLKGQILEVMPWKAEELFKRKAAVLLHKKHVPIPFEQAETTEKKEVRKETR